MYRTRNLTVFCASIAVLLGSFAGGITAQEPGDSANAKLRIVAYNIKHGRGMDGQVDLERAANLISKWKPDLVALQEIDRETERSGNVDQTKRLAKMTGLHGSFGPFFDYQGGQYGMAILSRKKPIRTTNHLLPAGREPRSALAIEVVPVANGPEIIFVGIHFYATEEERLAQAKRLLELLKNEERPVILAGDFNSQPASRVLGLFGSEWTVPDKGEDHFTFPSDEPRTEIDFILFRGLKNWTVQRIDVLDEPLVSDHRPVVLDLIPSRQ